MTIINTGFGI